MVRKSLVLGFMLALAPAGCNQPAPTRAPATDLRTVAFEVPSGFK